MSAFHNSQALLWDKASGQWLPTPLATFSWSIHDAGALYGAMVVERFRTFGGNLFDLSDRWRRFSLGLETLAIDFSLSQLEFTDACIRLLEMNRGLCLESGDVSIVVVASPGNLDSEEASAKILFHLSPIPWKKLANWYQLGTPLRISSYAAPPNVCLPSAIKTRSRLPYYLSDLEIRNRQTPSLQAPKSEALPLLTTVKNAIADTAVANIVVVDKKGVVRTPTNENVLDGCSLKLTEHLLSHIGVDLVRSDLDESELYEAREVWLTGSTGCIWQASCLNSRRVGTDSNFPLYQQINSLWIEHVRHDFQAQAIRLAQ